jgi:hypothetical protein
VLCAATGKPVAEYLRDKIWQQIGTEADASWAIDANGQEETFCCVNAVLRDYARFGVGCLLMTAPGRAARSFRGNG